MQNHLGGEIQGVFTQSVLRGVIHRRLGYLIKMTILCGVFCPNVNATSSISKISPYGHLFFITEIHPCHC